MNGTESRLEHDVEIVENEDGVYFVGEAVNTKYVTDKELNDIHKYLINQPIVYRHNHPAKKKGGSVFGRVVDSKIVEKNDKKSVIFRAKMKQSLQQHRDLIDLAKKQQELGKPIRYSVAFERVNGKDGVEAEVWEIAVTNNPVVKDAINFNIEMEQNDMSDEELDKDEIISQYQKEFEEKIGFKIEELENKLAEKDNLIKEKDEAVKELENKVKSFQSTGKEFESVLNEYSERLKETETQLKTANSKIAELEQKNEVAKRMPIVNEIFEMEGSTKMKERYMDPNKWTLKELESHRDEWKSKVERMKNLNRGVQLESLQHRLSKEELNESKEWEQDVKSKMSDELKSLLYGGK